jgi:hypothetical protein
MSAPDRPRAKLKVVIQLTETSQPIEHAAVNAYTKGPFYCVYLGGKVYKYPVANIWRVVEEYGTHA